MKPVLLKMQAFGSYGKLTEIDFTRPRQNLFLITGDTGAGKTTIFDAIVFALYGEASSGNNKKNGTELQSQYADLGTDPFVELTFLKSGVLAAGEPGAEEEALYTVRRSPRHFRPLKRRTGSAAREEKEKVSLLLPDGTEYPGNTKETDTRIEEIVGLSKDQFMQVAMIAQGEFMELLRVSSDDKKLIFRKLFRTEIFSDIVDELDRRCKEKAGQIESIRAAARADVQRILIPGNYERAEDISAGKFKVLSAKQFSLTDMETLLEELDMLCSSLKEQYTRQQELDRKALADRDAMMEAYTRGENLLKFYAQMESAEKELAWCGTQEETMQKSHALTQEISQAYEIRSKFITYTEAVQDTEHLKEKLAEEQERIPVLESAYAKSEQLTQEASVERSRADGILVKTKEQVTRALAAIENAASAGQKQKELREAFEKAQALASEAAAQVLHLEEQEVQYRKTVTDLSKAGELLEKWKQKQAQVNLARTVLQNLEKMKEESRIQSEELLKLEGEYSRVSAEYEVRREEHDRNYRLYLDEQAGILAASLKEGIPCPVCGSLTHPNPCAGQESGKILSRARIEKLGEQRDVLNQKQIELASALSEKRAVVSGTAKTISENEEELLRMLRAMAQAIPDLRAQDTMLSHETDSPEKLLKRCEEELKAESEILEQNAARYQEAVTFLESAGQKGKKLRAIREELGRSARTAGEEYAAQTVLLKALEEEAVREFADKKAAESALEKASSEQKKAQEQYERLHQEMLRAKKEYDSAQTLKHRYEAELPVKTERTGHLRESYETYMELYHMTSGQWRSVTDSHRLEEAESLRTQIGEYEKRKAAAQSLYDASREGIGGEEKPDMEERKARRDEAAEQYRLSQKNLADIRDVYNTNKGVLNDLKPHMKERARMMAEYDRLESLYSILGGKMTGARMDIETYVQRYYLQKVLLSANRRFDVMSAGQYELRMMDPERAGTGKNHGLDLMVYSAVTGREREVRTLSGGESFMAALSLALGMADQIRESTSAVSLDIMFIDEGFGSLDENSRDTAVRVLQEMVGSERMAGIISHVSELKHQIDDQLLITKDENGSHAQWV